MAMQPRKIGEGRKTAAEPPVPPAVKKPRNSIRIGRFSGSGRPSWHQAWVKYDEAEMGGRGDRRLDVEAQIDVAPETVRASPHFKKSTSRWERRCAR